VKIEIKSFGGSLLFKGDFSALSDAVQAAVKSGANLFGANLSRANLSGADLSRADLYGADLFGEKIARCERPFISVGPIGSRFDNLLAFMTEKGARLKTGCFFGTIKEFEDKVIETHGDNNHAKEYTAALAMIRLHFDMWKEVK
jgi:hypothetical protein